MLNPFDVALLMAESQRVIALRLWKLSWGGSAGLHEAVHMVSEKMTASAQATHSLMLGASPDSVVSGYRSIVQDNIRRLSA